VPNAIVLSTDIVSRLSRLEQTVAALVGRLESLDRGNAQPWEPEAPILLPNSQSPPGTPSAAPMFVIREVASQAGVRQQVSSDTVGGSRQDIISKGLLSISEALGMIDLYVLRC
jgi:hypothetical protein